MKKVFFQLVFGKPKKAIGKNIIPKLNSGSLEFSF